MSETKNVAFRSAIGGYNREDVNRYILDLNREFADKEKQAVDDLAAAESRLAEAVADLQKAKDAAAAESTALTAELDAARAELSSLQAKLAGAEETLSSLRRELDERPVLSAADKSEKYDQISAQIGDIMISASTSADAIVAAANEQAAKIISETEDEANYIRARLSDAADGMLSRISGELHVSTESCFTELMTALKEMRDSTEHLIRDFEMRSRDLDVKVEYYQSTVSDTIEAVLKEMDDKYGIRPSK